MAEIVGPAQTGWRERWPLVVIGAGACGLVAGLAAARRGVRAVILEKGAEVPATPPARPG